MAEEGSSSRPGQGNPSNFDLVSKSQLLEQLEWLKAKKTVLRKEMDELNYLISRTGTSYNEMEPISSLPNEVLSLIFLNSMESAASSKNFIGSRSVEIMISHVCRAWREIALSQSLLWCKIRCRTSAKFRTSYVNSARRLKTYLARSNPRPIDVWIDLEENFEMFGEQIFELILKHAHRWRVFSVNCKGLDLAVHLYLPLQNLFAPLLESLSIFLPPTDENHRAVVALEAVYMVDLSEHYTPSIFSQGAPQLSSICLEGAAVHFLRPPVSARLTTVMLDKRYGDLYLPAQQLKELLQLPFLSCLSLDGEITEFPELLASCGSMRAEGLQHLRFTNGPVDAFCQLIATLATPNLETLVLTDIKAPAHSLPQTPSSLPRLRSLTFNEINYPIQTPFRTLIASICSSVTQIAFRLPHYANNLHTILFDDDSVGTAGWPNLTTLTAFSLSAEDTKTLESYVSLRLLGEQPIQTIRLDYNIKSERRLGLLRSLNIDVQLCIQNNEWPPETVFGLDSDVFKTFLQPPVIKIKT